MRVTKGLLIAILALGVAALAQAQLVVPRAPAPRKFGLPVQYRAPLRSDNRPGRERRIDRLTGVENQPEESAPEEDENLLPAPPETVSEGYLAANPVSLNYGLGQPALTETPPINWDGVVYVSVSDYFKALGTTGYWDPTVKSAFAVLKDGRWVVIPLEQQFIYLDRKQTPLKPASAIVNSVMMVPLRSLSEALGYTVHWDEARNTATVVPPAIPKAARKPAPTAPAATPAVY